MELQGICHKMHAALKTHSVTDQSTSKANVEYKFILDRSETDLPFILGQELEIEWTGNLFCTSCGSKTPKSYSQGHCFKCFKTKAECDLCIMKPETCNYHLGTCREDEFAHKVCFQPHIVYLALSSEVKVGVTRKTQVPTRWIDQGAVQAIPIVEVPNRYLAGITEVALKNHFADKTNWQKMLKNEVPNMDLIAERNKVFDWLPNEVKDYFPKEEKIIQMDFPVLQYPKKVSSLNLDKTPNFSGKLAGIKGQYLLFEDGTVFNVRTYEGYVVKMSL